MRRPDQRVPVGRWQLQCGTRLSSQTAPRKRRLNCSTRRTSECFTSLCRGPLPLIHHGAEHQQLPPFALSLSPEFRPPVRAASTPIAARGRTSAAPQMGSAVLKQPGSEALGRGPGNVAAAPSTPHSILGALEAYRLELVAHLQRVGAPVLLAHLGRHVPRPAALETGPDLRDILAGDARFQIDGRHPTKTLSLAAPSGTVRFLPALCVHLSGAVVPMSSKREGDGQLVEALVHLSRLEQWKGWMWQWRALLSLFASSRPVRVRFLMWRSTWSRWWRICSMLGLRCCWRNWVSLLKSHRHSSRRGARG